ncbi:hypothetical protein HQ529_05300, partial [Candidatus Woesearchaeota archaeon]|nr:hypothetical protein [Candidatus Woesearchaeota archaeon]
MTPENDNIDSKVLHVEDSAVWQIMVGNILKDKFGKDNVDLAKNYVDALSLVISNPYDFYFLDGKFPEHDGKEENLGIKLAKEIYEREGSYDKIIIVSASPNILKEAE